MGAVIGLMLWFYITALAVLIGAELNAELAKQRVGGTMCELPQKPGKPATETVPAAAP